MLTYLSSRGCPKCGNKSTQDTHYHEGAEYLYLGSPGVHRPERIRRRCYRCAYCWDEAPLDAALAPRAEPQPEEAERCWAQFNAETGTSVCWTTCDLRQGHEGEHRSRTFTPEYERDRYEWAIAPKPPLGGVGNADAP